MIRTHVVFLCLAVSTTLGAQGARMRFEAMDQNRDGAIARAEWRGSARSFQNHDWNGDGQLSGPEVAAGAQRNANWDAADHTPNRYERFASWTPAGFNNLDHNRDRRISSNEWHFDLETFRRVDRNRDSVLDEAEFLGNQWDDDRGDRFDDIDMNNDGRVERSEWHGGANVFTSLDRNRDGALSRFEVVGGVETGLDAWDQFVALDYDRNGGIARNEWHWSNSSFNLRDQNRDGVLSRREFDVAGGAPGGGAVGTSGLSRMVRVNGQFRWTDSGIDVRAGDLLTIEASGTMRLSDNGQDTATPAGSATGRRAADAPILDQQAGTLIAQIDNYGPIFIGGQRTFAAPVTGRLYFGVNDDHLPDNRGEYVVNVGIQPRR